MKRKNLFAILNVFAAILLTFSSCEIDTSTDPEEKKAENIELSIENLTPGYFDLKWNKVDGASWYFVKIEKDGVIISDDYDGIGGRQQGLITDGVAELNVSGAVKTGETYTITVTASDYLIGGVTKAIGTKDVTMPALPTELLGTWTTTSYLGDDLTFNADGSVTTTETDKYFDSRNWTIEKSDLVIINHYPTNDQTFRYSYELSGDGNTLTLTEGDNQYTLTKSAN